MTRTAWMMLVTIVAIILAAVVLYSVLGNITSTKFENVQASVYARV